MRNEILDMLREAPAGISGQEMSRRLNVSRTAVWKGVEALRQEGYEIASATNRGYRLISCPDVLTEAAIRPYISARRLGENLICLDAVDSTNTHLKDLAARGAPDGTVVVTDTQTGGRGRLNRGFLSPPGEGVYLSALLRPDIEAADVTAITAMAAVAVCEAIAAVSAIRPGIKWVNDIVCDDKKLCGILTELSVEFEMGRVQSIVIGAGINVKQQDFPEELRDRAASLWTLGDQAVRRSELAGALISSFDRVYSALGGGEEVYMERYRALSATVGRDIRVIIGGRERDAVALAIEDGGGLMVRYPDGQMETLRYGEVSVRRK